MAILVTGAAGLVGRAAAALLRQDVEHVRAVVRDSAQVAGLRRLGAIVALLDATDPDGLAAAMDGVFTACSLTGSLWSLPGRTVRGRGRAGRGVPGVTAAVGVRRVVVCSPAAVGTADPPTGQPPPGRQGRGRADDRRLRPGARDPAPTTCSAPAAASSTCSPPACPSRSRATAASASPPSGRRRGRGHRRRRRRRRAGRHLVAVRPGRGRASTPWSTPSTAGRAAATSPRGRAGLTHAQAEVLAADSLADPALARPPGLVLTPLAETLAATGALARR